MQTHAPWGSQKVRVWVFKLCARQALRRASLSGDGASLAPGDSDAAASAASDIDTDGCGSGEGAGRGGAVWQPLAEAAPPVPGREWVPIQAGSLPVDPHGFYQLVLCEGVRALREQDMHGVTSLFLHMQNPGSGCT